MITRVSLKNFKLHASTEIEAAPITVFIGPNNSGKSSIFQALLSLRQAASMSWDTLYHRERHRFPERLILDIGEYNDVVRQGENEIRISIEGEMSVPRTESYCRKVGISFDVWVRDNLLAYHRGNLTIPLPSAGAVSWIVLNLQKAASYGTEWKLGWEWRGAAEVERPSITLQNVPSSETITLLFSIAARFGFIDPGGTSGPSGVFPPERHLEAIGFQELLGNAPRRLLASLHPIFPLRGFEEWGYPLPDSSASNLDRLVLADRAVALASILAYDREMERRLSEWLERFDIAIEAPLVPPKRVIIRAKKPKDGKASSLFLNEGTGVNQLPFILIPIGLVPENETILLCEPEAHLHPYGQSELMKLLFKVQKDRKLQYFIETHSEHVLHALLHAVAKGDLEKNQLAIYYFENINGEAKVRRLEVDDKGRVEGGLPGFFEQSLAELAEYVDALKKT